MTQPNHSSEYHLCAQGGRLVMTFESRTRALEEAHKRNLKVFEVTTTKREILQ